MLINFIKKYFNETLFYRDKCNPNAHSAKDTCLILNCYKTFVVASC